MQKREQGPRQAELLASRRGKGPNKQAGVDLWGALAGLSVCFLKEETEGRGIRIGCGFFTNAWHYSHFTGIALPRQRSPYPIQSTVSDL